MFRFQRTTLRPLVYGHRGAKALVTENTLASFRRAIEDGADGVELDVRTTRDGVVVVMHDPELRRMTSGRDDRAIADVTARELERVELDGGERAPTLADVLDWADAASVRVNVELKHDTHDKQALVRGVARLLRGRARVAERVILSSFDPELLARAAVLVPRTPRAFLFNAEQRFSRTPLARLIARSVGAIALNPERTLCSQERVAAWKARGMLVNVWTVNDADEAWDLARLGVDGLISDDPARVLTRLQSASSAVSRS